MAGRTDRGVHARGQVASHAGEPAAPRDRSTGCCPRTSRVLASEPAPDGFDARRDAAQPHLPLPRARRGRRRARSSAVAGALVAAAARPRRAGRRARRRWSGPHDFTAFTPTETDHVRFERHVLRAEWVAEREDVLAFVIEADSVHAQHGARARRHDAAAGRESGRVRARCWRAARAPRRGRRRPPTASTWSRSATEYPRRCEGSAHQRRRHQRHRPARAARARCSRCPASSWP